MGKKLFALFLITAFCFHFIMTAIYVLPLNPVKAKGGILINSYMQPLFEQNWQLFAPDPLSNDFYIYLQVENKDGSHSDWFDLSTTLYKENQKNRISPNNRMVRLGPSSFLQTLRVDETVEKLKEKVPEDKLKSIEKKRGNEEFQQYGIDILYRYASSYVVKLFNEEDVERVRVRVLVEEAIPFSKKRDPNVESKKTYTTFDWEKYVKVLTP
ncbi:DNA-directed RNA polymerase subunit beta [Viridibacillus sp. YIM B01967]|uniref:DNA-directed RNA polymerase subunit beta n=1 Tax=Viridibacillus soli TaxID=2798301 RepID=A0ABS1HCM0_9BACL|nr:DUF5819 family protein [Viridibacillus soli]MBK3497195.1 DNA-directed RNA polymerase subunit beta [Viridibacillus soli]